MTGHAARGLSYFPYYPDDFAGDGKVAAMTTEEVGAYWLILSKAWREDPPGSIPDDDRVLARWARLSPHKWRKTRPAVLAPFQPYGTGRLIQRRMHREYLKLVEKSSKAKEAAERRWTDRNTDAYRTQSAGNANAVRPVCQPEPEPDPDPPPPAPRDPPPGGRGPRPEDSMALMSPENLVQAWNQNRGGMAEADSRISAPRRRRIAFFLRNHRGLRPSEFGSVVARLGRDDWACGRTSRRSSPITIDTLLAGDAYERQREKLAFRQQSETEIGRGADEPETNATKKLRELYNSGLSREEASQRFREWRAEVGEEFARSPADEPRNVASS